MHLIAIGRLRAGPEADLFARYNIRLRPRLVVAELPEERGTAAVIKRKEGIALLAAMPKDAFAVPLDLGGKALSSEAFATRLTDWSRLSRPVCFLIGGAEGLDAPVIARADDVLSLGPMTWPHLLVRGMLAEQLYRAQAISQGHPYHRAGRPGQA
jgi:23S rRNA (pseudouridine1915-N3)-methyltransferase